MFFNHNSVTIMNSFLCNAVSHADGREVVATCILPTPINAKDYQLKLVYVSVLPNFRIMHGLHLNYTGMVIVSGASKKVTSDLHFDQVPFTDAAIDIIAKQMHDEYGGDMKKGPYVKIMKSKKDEYTLKLAKKSRLVLSESLAKALGCDEELVNDSDDVLQLELNPVNTQFIDTDIYYISCDQACMNFSSSDGRALRILDVLQLNNVSEKEAHIERIAGGQYYALEGNVLSSLKFRLLKSTGEPVRSVNATEFYVLAHICPKSVLD